MQILKRLIIILVVTLALVESYSLGLSKGIAVQEQADRENLQKNIKQEITKAYFLGQVVCALRHLGDKSNDSGK